MNPNERHIIDELKKAATPLPSDTYFTQLKNDMLAKVTSENRIPGEAKIVPLYRKWWAIVAAAASVVLIATLFLRSEEPEHPTAQQPDWNSLSREDVLAYIDDNIDEFEAETIAAHLDSLPSWHTHTPSAETSAPVSVREQHYDELFDAIEKEDILRYLQEEAIELDDELLIGS